MPHSSSCGAHRSSFRSLGRWTCTVRACSHSAAIHTLMLHVQLPCFFFFVVFSILASPAWAKFSTLQFWPHENLMEEIRSFNQARSKTCYIFSHRPAAIFDLPLLDQVQLPGPLQVLYQLLVIIIWGSLGDLCVRSCSRRSGGAAC